MYAKLSLVVGLVLLLVAGVAGADSRALDITEGVDLPGNDYRTIKEVTQAQCEAACLDDARCQAFTFNRAAKWCFLKSTAGKSSSFAGAVSGRVVAGSAAPEHDAETEILDPVLFSYGGAALLDHMDSYFRATAFSNTATMVFVASLLRAHGKENDVYAVQRAIEDGIYANIADDKMMLIAILEKVKQAYRSYGENATSGALTNIFGITMRQADSLRTVNPETLERFIRDPSIIKRPLPGEIDI